MFFLINSILFDTCHWIELRLWSDLYLIQGKYIIMIQSSRQDDFIKDFLTSWDLNRNTIVEMPSASFRRKSKSYAECIDDQDVLYVSDHEMISGGEQLWHWTMNILFGSKTGGNFLCIPGWRMGCELSYLSDVFWNQNSILGDDQRFGYEMSSCRTKMRAEFGQDNKSQTSIFLFSF